jgi:hypothetical protein
MQDYGIELATRYFDETSPLPESKNAGNRFYGEEVVTFIKTQLALHDFTISDEDWGWLLCGMRDGYGFEYGVSHWGTGDGFGHDSSVATNDGNWYIRISMTKPGKVLGLVPWNRSIDCLAPYGLALVDVFQQHRITVKRHGLEN